VERAAPEIAAAGFSVAWLPPPTDPDTCHGQHAPPVKPLQGAFLQATRSIESDGNCVQGYMPTDLYNLNSAYGSADSLKK
jgi:hypothetical protein